MGAKVLADFDAYLPHFKKLIPNDYKKMLTLSAKLEEKGLTSEQAQMEAFYEASEQSIKEDEEMGKPTGFLDYEQRNSKSTAAKGPDSNFNEFRTPLQQRKTETSGSTLHGMRRSLLPGRNDARRNGVRLSAAQPGS